MDEPDDSILLNVCIKDCRGVMFFSFFFKVGMNETFSEISQRLQKSVLKPKEPQVFEYMTIQKVTGSVILKTDTPNSLELKPLDSIDAQSQYFEVDKLKFEFNHDERDW